MRRTLPCWSSTRALTPAALLKTIRSDPGMTANYYANRYFGKETVMHVNHLLWAQLKRHGKVTLDRSDGSDHPPRWYPLFESPKLHSVAWHNADDEDLSVLRDAAPEDIATPRAPAAPPAPWAGITTATGSSSSSGGGGEAGDDTDSLRVETLVLHLVEKEPGKDIQHYIGLLPFDMRMAAPLAFKRLRESGLLTRETTPHGTFVWR